MDVPDTRLSDLLHGLLFFVSGVLIVTLSALVWINDSFLKPSFLVGFLIGPYFVVASIAFFRDALRSRSEA